MIWGRRWAVCGLVWATLMGCSPTFNWRQARPEGGSVTALLPCKPTAAQRRVPLAGQEAALSMLSCDVGDLTFALAALRVPAGMTSADVASAWQKASAVSLQADPSALQGWLATVPRLPQGLVVQGWRVQGVRHDGRSVSAQALQVLRPNEVAQLVVYGSPAPDVLQSLWDGVQVDAAP